MGGGCLGAGALPERRAQGLRGIRNPEGARHRCGTSGARPIDAPVNSCDALQVTLPHLSLSAAGARMSSHATLSSSRLKSPEFRQRAVELAQLHEKPIARIAKDLQISESCLRGWMDQADIGDQHKPGTH